MTDESLDESYEKSWTYAKINSYLWTKYYDIHKQKVFYLRRCEKQTKRAKNDEKLNFLASKTKYFKN